MQKFFLTIFVVCFSCITVFSQNKTVTGTVRDTFNVKSVVFASVSLIRKSDSILISHSRSNQQGQFTMNVKDTGKYIILIAHGSFADYVDDIEITSADTKKELGAIGLFQRSQMLKEVIVKNAASIKIKGDTLEYLADSFKVKQGAMVEDLLKVLPGIQVNKKGEITAMGEKVEKVLVDGEEFFGDDPTIATQNIQSKVVEKVQVFDKKSDQAQFTGFDDGQEQKTINLKLKDNMNRGEFGKVELGGGLYDRWQNQAMVNSFKNKRQISVYGLMSSNGKTGLGWEDKNTYTGDGGGGMQMDEDGGFMWNMSSDDDDVDWGGRNNTPEGITKAWVGGAHYANKWNEGKHHINTNYSFGRINKTKKETSYRENILPSGKYYTIDTSSSYSSRNTHRISGKYTWMIDSSLTLIYNLNSRIGFNESISNNNTNNQSFTEVPINNSNRAIENNSTTTRVTNTITANKKFKKTGRTASLNVSHTYNNSDGLGSQIGYNDYNIAGVNTHEILDQQKDQQQLKSNLSADLTYTEPLSKKFLLKATYGYAAESSLSDNKTLVKPNAIDDEYTVRIDSLSTEFDSKVYSHTAGAELKFNEKKYNVTAGAKVRYSMFHQDDLVRNKNYDYNRINVFPTVRFNYKFDQFRRFNFSYNGSTRQPSITQLQPVQDNSNPLEVYVGNPDLKIGYTQNFNIGYFSYKVLSARSLYAGASFSNSFNNIALNTSIDALGRSVNQYVNLNGGYNANMYGGINTKIPKTPLEGKLNVGGNYAHTPNITNNITGFTDALSLTFTPGLTFAKEEKFFTTLDLGTVFSKTTNTIQTARNIQYMSFTPSASVEIYLPYNLEFGTDADYQYTPPVAPYKTSFQRFIWGAYLSYNILPKKNLELKASINDILNQNKGYERTTTNNTNTERYFQTLGRYWMLSAVWNFSTGPMAQSKPKSNYSRQRMRGGGGRRRH